MPTAIPTASLSLGRLLATPYRFVVPPYQRGYAWTTKEAVQLLEDILAASGADGAELAEPDYFLGSMLLLDAAGAGDFPAEPAGFAAAPDRWLEIVDGQQRMVTLCLIAAVLRDLESGPSSPTAARLHAMIATANPEAAPAGEASRGSPWRVTLRGRQQDVLAACVLEPGACGEMPDDEGLTGAQARIVEIREELITLLSDLDDRQRTALADYLIDKCHFVVMLTRDIDRAHRMFLVLNGRGRPLGRHDILKAEILSAVDPDASDQVVRAWEEIAEGLDPDAFEELFSHIRTIHGQRRPQIIAGMRATIAATGGASAFLETVFKPLAAAYREILQAPTGASQLPAAVRQPMIYLARLNGREWVPAAMVAIGRYRDDPAQLAEILNEIDRFAHVMRILCLGSGKRVTRFAPVIIALQAGAPIAEICRFDREDQKTIAYHLRDLHSRAAQICKLVLLRLDDRLTGRQLITDPADWSIEHVLPKRPSPTSPWRTIFPDPREREAATQSLGNLLLVSPLQNELAKNQPFDRKQQVFREALPEHRLALMSDVLSASEWTPASVDQRKRKFFSLLDEMWSLALDSATRAVVAESEAPPSAPRRIRRH